MNEFLTGQGGVETQELSIAEAFAHLQAARGQVRSMGNVDFEEGFIADLEQKLGKNEITPIQAVEAVDDMLAARIER